MTRNSKLFIINSEKKENDAALLFTTGSGVRFNIGFKGTGNPEISLDDVSRFDREIESCRKSLVNNYTYSL